MLANFQTDPIIQTRNIFFSQCMEYQRHEEERRMLEIERKRKEIREQLEEEEEALERKKQEIEIIFEREERERAIQLEEEYQHHLVS